MDAFIRNLDKEIHRAAKTAAAVRDETLNDFITRAITRAVEDDPVAKELLDLVRNRTLQARPRHGRRSHAKKN